LQVNASVGRIVVMPTDSDLAQIAEHLHYEIAMLWSSGLCVQRGGGYPTAVQNCILESFALHARNVIDFFYTDPIGDDVVARHFFSREDAWAQVRPAAAAVLVAAKKRANKEVSHLTYSRLVVSPEKKPWQYADIVKEIDVVLRVFCDNADRLPDKVKLLEYKDLLP
jgi:hypothetical protein